MKDERRSTRSHVVRIEDRKTAPRGVPYPQIAPEPTPPPMSLWEARHEGKLDQLAEQLADLRVQLAELAHLAASYQELSGWWKAVSLEVRALADAHAAFRSKQSWFFDEQWPRVRDAVERIEKMLADRKVDQVVVDQDTEHNTTAILALQAERDAQRLEISNLQADRQVQAALDLAKRRRQAAWFGVLTLVLAAIAILVSLRSSH